MAKKVNRAWLSVFLQGHRRKRRNHLLPAPVLVAQYPSLAVWEWNYANPFRWNAYHQVIGLNNNEYFFDDFVGGSARQYAPDGGQHLMFIVGVDADGNEITERSNAVRPDDAESPIPAGQIHYWSFYETEGTRSDSLSGVDLADNNGVSRVTVGGRTGANFLFTAEQFLSCSGTLLRFQDPFTFSIWVRASYADVESDFLGKDSGDGREFVVQSGSDGDFLNPYIYTEATGSVGFATGVPAETWFHLAVSFDGTFVSLYFDGELVTQNEGAPTETDTEFRVGARVYEGSEGYFDGQMSQLRIWDRALSDAEVLSVFNL